MKVQIWMKPMQFLGVQKYQKLQTSCLVGVLFLDFKHLEESVDRTIFKRFATFWMPMALSMT